MMFKIAAFFVSIALIAGCMSEEVKSVEWWVENSAEREDKLLECEVAEEAKDSMSPNCINAREAETQVGIFGQDEEDRRRSPSF